MIKARSVKIFILAFALILQGFFLISCEKPEAPDKDTQKLAQLTEKVEKLTKRVDQLSRQVDQLGQNLGEFSEKFAIPQRGGSLVVCLWALSF